MADHIIDYVEKYGDVPFSEREFNDVDSLVLSQFAYLKLDGIVPDVDENGSMVTVKELSEHPGKDRLFGDERYREVNTALFEAMACGRRFSGMGINFYENIIDKEKETQFSAMTFFLEKGLIYIAYRGTDETIVGWKEDFNMAFSRAVPGQMIAVKYLNHAARKFAGSFLMGGHSKGGNFAVYAAMKCEQDLQGRIEAVYSHDGPGFRPELLNSDEYEKISGKVHKILPRSSLIGMLLQQQENYDVVESKSMGVMQHNPFSWQIKDGDFVRVKEIYHGRKVKDEALNEWILSLEEEQLHLFVDTLFQIIEASEADNLIDFTAEWKKSSIGVLNALKEIEPDTRKILMQIIGRLFEITAEKMKAELKKGARSRKKAES